MFETKSRKPITIMIAFCLIAALAVSGCLGGTMTVAKAEGGLESAAAPNITIQPTENKDGLLRNPAMGWVLYVDNALDAFRLADFGDAIDQASILYIRVVWADLEPEEGKYAWIYNERFKDFVQEAKKRGLKLAFAVNVNAQDSYRQSTPEYVRLAGAEGTVIPFGRSVKGQIKSVTTTAGSLNGSISDIVDNDEASAWSSALNPTFPQYITFDFGQDAVTSNNISIVSEYGQGQGIANADVEYWNGNAWTAAVRNVPLEWGRNSGTEEARTITYPATSSTKIRLKVNEANLQYGSFAISEAYISDNSPTQQYWTPYEDDPVFREKFAKFMDAFAAEYDNPAITDFVDISGLGWWGEMHHLNLRRETEAEAANWLTSVFTSRFNHVLLNSLEGGYLIDLADQTAINGITAGIRRCSYASPEYLSRESQDKIVAVWKKGVPVFAENNFQNYETWTTTWSPFYPNVGSLLRQAITDAIYTHANTLDMRRPDDAHTWVTKYPDMVHYFNKYGGYRFVLNAAELPQTIKSGESFAITQSWKNTGVGLFPNKRPNWDHKYKVAYALLDKTTGEPVSYRVMNDIEPGDWIRGPVYKYSSEIGFAGAGAGDYDLGVAIVDTTLDDAPSIRLAIESPKTSEGWYKIGELHINE